MTRNDPETARPPPRTARLGRRVQRRPRAIPPQYEALLEEEASWDTLRRHIVENEELTPELRDQALEAVAELQPLLGDSWPYDVYGTEHPMAQCLANWAPHAVA